MDSIELGIVHAVRYVRRSFRPTVRLTVPPPAKKTVADFLTMVSDPSRAKQFLFLAAKQLNVAPSAINSTVTKMAIVDLMVKAYHFGYVDSNSIVVAAYSSAMRSY